MLKSDAFTTPEEICDYLVPHVPDDVREVAEFLEVFTNPAVAWGLRPMIFTWWA